MFGSWKTWSFFSIICMIDQISWCLITLQQRLSLKVGRECDLMLLQSTFMVACAMKYLWEHSEFRIIREITKSQINNWLATNLVQGHQIDDVKLLSLSIIIKIASESTWMCLIEKLLSVFFLACDHHEFFAQWIEHFMDLFSPSYDSITFNHFFLLSLVPPFITYFLRSIRHWNFAHTKDFFKHIERVDLNGAKFIHERFFWFYDDSFIHLKSMNCAIVDKTNGINLSWIMT